MNPVRSVTFAALLASAIFLSGCKPDKAVENSTVIDGGAKPSATTPVVDTSSYGTVTGVTLFKGKAPARVPIDMSMDSACAMAGGSNLSEQIVTAGDKLANVYVYVKTGAPTSSAPANAAPVILDQRGCKYIPHVIAVQQGGTVEFRNSDPTMHNVHTMPTIAGNQTVDVSEGPNGQPQTRPFAAAEAMMPVRCNNHPWMSAFINVAPNPYFAVTSGDGKFSITLPPGTYTLAAVQEKLGEQDVTVTVPAKGTANANFAFGLK